jgi:hypothetical protein
MENLRNASKLASPPFDGPNESSESPDSVNRSIAPIVGGLSLHSSRHDGPSATQRSEISKRGCVVVK